MKTRPHLTLMAVYGGLRRFMAVYGGLWRFMAVYGGLWRFMAVYGGLWRFTAVYGGLFGRFWSDLVAFNHVLVGFWPHLVAFHRVGSGVSRVYSRGVSEVYQMARLRHDLAGSGVIFGPLWPARGPLMAVYGGLRRLIWSVFGRIRSFWLAFGWFLVGPPRFQPQ